MMNNYIVEEMSTLDVEFPVCLAIYHKCNILGQLRPLPYKSV